MMRITALFLLALLGLAGACQKEEQACGPEDLAVAILMDNGPFVAGTAVDIKIRHTLIYSSDDCVKKGIDFSTRSELMIRYRSGASEPWQQVATEVFTVPPIPVEGIDVDYSFSFQEPGEYRFCVATDITNLVAERDESNNTACSF